MRSLVNSSGKFIYPKNDNELILDYLFMSHKNILIVEWFRKKSRKQLNTRGQ